MSKQLTKCWGKYEEPIPRIPFYYRLAMVYEKRGEYKQAAQVCIEALQADQADDGTKGGMQARLQRMIKKGKFEPTQEMMEFL